MVRWLLDAAAVRFADLTEGVDHPRVDTARERLALAAQAATGAGGGLSGWTRTWLGAVPLTAAVWVVATVAGPWALDLPGGWVIAVTVLVLVGLVWPIHAVTNLVADRVNRRRTRPSDTPLNIVWSSSDPAEQLLGLLYSARQVLSVVATGWAQAGRFGHLAGTPAGFAWLIGHDRRLSRVSEADRCVSQALYSIEIWLDDGGRR